MSEPADLILHGGRVWTVDPERPEARAVAVRGDRFVAVGPEQEVLGLRGPATQVIELGDRLALPGFIDAHTHFGNAAAWLFRVSLYEVGDAPLAIDKVAAAAQLVPEGLWITGGDLGAADAWVADRAGRPRPAPPAVDRSALDRAAPRHPVLLRRVAAHTSRTRSRWRAPASVDALPIHGAGASIATRPQASRRGFSSVARASG